MDTLSQKSIKQVQTDDNIRKEKDINESAV
jgi:hypothetical protein